MAIPGAGQNPVEETIVGSPMKKQRASIYGDSEAANSLPPMANVLGDAEKLRHSQLLHETQAQAEAKSLQPPSAVEDEL